MRYQTVAGRVEADRPQSAGVAGGARDVLRARGAELDVLLRTEISAMAHACARVPEPRQLFYDLAPQRGRAASIVTIGACLEALRREPTLPARRLHAFGMTVRAWIDSLMPDASESLVDAWSRETTTQASADVAQAHALTALERNDRGALDRAIAETATHLDALHQLLAMMQSARRRLEQPPVCRPRVVLVGVGRTQ